MKQPIFNAVPAILIAAMIAFIAGLSWLLRWLHADLGLGYFLIFCIVTFGIMVACGYLVDYLSAGPASDHGHPAAGDDHNGNT